MPKYQLIHLNRRNSWPGFLKCISIPNIINSQGRINIQEINMNVLFISSSIYDPLDDTLKYAYITH